ncbi:MAG: hypothetical protein Q8R32_00010 [bacterium]|nr:hypothetical protein [bacterium]
MNSLMMDYNMMHGMYGGGFMAFGWIVFVLVVANLLLGAVALWKYIQKK